MQARRYLITTILLQVLFVAALYWETKAYPLFENIARNLFGFNADSYASLLVSLLWFWGLLSLLLLGGGIWIMRGVHRGHIYLLLLGVVINLFAVLFLGWFIFVGGKLQAF